MQNETETVIEGLISVKAVLESGNRKIKRIYIRDKKRLDKDKFELEQLALKRNIDVKRVKAEHIDNLARGKTHGGIIALVSKRNFVNLDDLLKDKQNPFIVMLDGIEDPFNFGHSVRTLYALGIDGLVLRPRNWMSSAGIVAKSSAGTSELIPTAIVENADDAADFFKERNLLVTCTGIENSISIYEVDFNKSLFLLLGGEKRGITRSFKSKSDYIIRIPYVRNFNFSLGVTSASSIIAYEVMKQRQQNR